MIGTLCDLKHEYHRYLFKKLLFILFCLITAIIVMGLAVSFGKYDIGFFESYELIWNHLLGHAPVDEMKDHVVWDLRLPRALMAVAVGAGLAVCGAAMQSMMRNPLADPYTTGVSSGASLGAALAIILGFCIFPSLSGQAAIVANAFIFSLIPAAIIILISKFRRPTPTSMILAGIAVMYVFSATTTLLMLIANPEDLAEVYIWNVGTLGKATWDNIPIVLFMSVTGIILLMLVSKKLNVLVAGDKVATSLGVNADVLRLYCLIVISLVTAAIVSFTGTIGFVGLIAPHVVRIFIGSDNRYLLPASASFGAAMLICADCLAKEAGSTGLPVGVITAIIGGPLFILLLIKQRKSAWK
ncbi:FecCD family ABC transporter permease [Candidatus Methanomassiliicoccus intestinalis]|uniref:FecCD family ABC transporter permease n=1 Tax=Candidatus Methanomassiliicoccus intestinalis TaxID=1406512 RepID=UPI0037DCC0A8